MKKLFSLLLIPLLLLGGCAPAEETEQPLSTYTEPATEIIQVDAPPTEEPEKEFGLSYLESYGLNPYLCTATANRAAFSLLYESLFTVTETFQAEPVLCESFRSSEDRKTYTFTLLEGLCFSDGTPVTSADLEASLAMARQSPMYKHRLSRISYYVPDGERSIVIQLSVPYENFALMLDFPILKADTVEGPTPIGTGPYVLQGNLMLKNAHWWSSDPPAVDVEQIPLYPCTETGQLRDNFEFGGTNLVYFDPNSAASVGFRCDYEVWDAPTTVMHYIGFNLYSGYFANNTLRKAVTYIIDREDMVNKIYGGYALESPLPCSPASDLYDEQLAESYDYSPASFRSALEESGVLSSADYANHSGIFLVNAEDPTRVRAAEYLCEVLTGYGLKMEVSAVDAAAYKTALSKGNFDLYYGETRLTANFDLSEFFKDKGALSYGRIASDSLYELCIKAYENSGNFVELCSRIAQDGRLCPVVFKSYGVFITRGRMTQLVPGLDCVFRTGTSRRTLADADRTYQQEVPQETEASEAPSEPTQP